MFCGKGCSNGNFKWINHIVHIFIFFNNNLFIIIFIIIFKKKELREGKNGE